jgi:hypothetical protein
VASSYGIRYGPTNIAPFLSSLPTIIKPGKETKIIRRSPLNLGYVLGLGDLHHALGATRVEGRAPHLLSTVESPSISPSLAHTLSSQFTKSLLSPTHRYIGHDVTVTHHTSQHSISKIMSIGKNEPDRDANHGSVNGFVHVTHALVPTITRVTTTTLSTHGVTKSPTVTIVNHSIVPAAALNTGSSQGLSKQSTVTITPECLSKTMITVNHGQTNHDLVSTTVTEDAKDDSSMIHTVIQKDSTLTRDPDPILRHEVSVTHIADGAFLTPGAGHKSLELPEEHNEFRTHYGGFGVGIDFGGHGSGHGFYV